MKTIQLGHGEITASAVSLGCMRMRDLTVKEAEVMIRTALEQGINFFDHADVYGDGKSEEIFANAAGMMPAVREKMILQSKCGIRHGYFDFSKEHILEAVDGSLKRLKTDYLDVLLLHRPDALVEPEEVAEAFTLLHSSGKVRYFGVSNHTPMQIELLKKYLNQKLIINQLQFGIMHTGMVNAGLHMNMEWDGAVDRDGGILDYCRLNDVTIQAWSPYQYGYFDGVFLGNEKFPDLNRKIGEIAEKHGMADTAVATAWILRHPANMQVIVGTMNPSRLKDISKGADIELTRQEWYEIYLAAGNKLP